MNVNDLNDYPIEQTKAVVAEATKLPLKLRDTLDTFQQRIDRLTAQDKKPSVNQHRRITDDQN